MNIYLVPVLTIVVAWIAISLPVYLLFQPKQLQAIWKSLSVEISKVILAELSTSNVADKLVNPSAMTELKPTIETHIDQFLRVKLLEKMPFLSTFLGESTLTKLKTGMMEEIELLLPAVIEQYISKSLSPTGLPRTINTRLDNIDTEQLRKIIRGNLRGKIIVVKWWAVLIGLIVGLAQIAIISL